MDAFYLKLIDINDGHSFYNLLDRNRKRLEDYFAGTLKYANSLDDIIEYCATIVKRINEKSYFPYFIIEKQTDSVIGLIDFKNIDWSIPKAEIGAFIDKGYEGKGIMLSYIPQLIDNLVKEHHFKKIFCRVNESNVRSINLVLNCGFELEGTLRREYKKSDGVVVDLNYYGKLYN